MKYYNVGKLPSYTNTSYFIQISCPSDAERALNGLNVA